MKWIYGKLLINLHGARSRPLKLNFVKFKKNAKKAAEEFLFHIYRTYIINGILLYSYFSCASIMYPKCKNIKPECNQTIRKSSKSWWFFEWERKRDDKHFYYCFFVSQLFGNLFYFFPVHIYAEDKVRFELGKLIIKIILQHIWMDYLFGFRVISAEGGIDRNWIFVLSGRVVLNLAAFIRDVRVLRKEVKTADSLE